ncbi:hypothetical protein GCM10023149_21120 [Mucilaginibacter gynuensis]|uniref:Uncharacterized protein n=1 Tax=Mucilaginibacter gynuensis TaxID=1302236 RepID=A0ABP8GC51_9SPHI
MEDQTNSTTNEQGAEDTEEKKTLIAGEFAFERNATFKLDKNKPVIKVKNDGTMSITFNYTLEDKTRLQTAIGDIVFIESGIFTEKTDINLDDPSSFSEFSLDIEDTLDKIFIISKDTKYMLKTTAVKGRQGNSFAQLNKKV